MTKKESLLRCIGLIVTCTALSAGRRKRVLVAHEQLPGPQEPESRKDV
jgi:hypothetical protein